MTRLIHTGDIHLGARLQFLGALGQTIRAQLRTTFARVLTLARTGTRPRSWSPATSSTACAPRRLTSAAS